MLKLQTLRNRFLSIRAQMIASLLMGVIAIMSSNTVQANQASPTIKTPGALPNEAEGFAFLNGEWRVHNRKLKEPLSSRTEWAEFETQAKFFTLLDGLVSVEELRDAAGAPFGSAMRTFNREKRTWSDAWVAARDGVLQSPSYGSFVGDAGTWTSPDVFNGKPMLARGVWRRISKDEVTWEQDFSLDDGKTWETNWKMRFVRKLPIGTAGK